MKNLSDCRVLLVDDTKANLEVLVAGLKADYKLSVALSGEAALQLAARALPDLVLLDVLMPGLDGYEVARRLRALALKNPFQIIAVTGWGQETDRRKSQKAGFDLHLVKPVALNDLKRILTESNDASLH